MIMISFPDRAVSSRSLRTDVGGCEDLGVDDAQEEHGHRVDDGDAGQTDRDCHHIRSLVTIRDQVTGEVRI